MATNTTKLGLIKPDFVDVVDVSDLNSNADDIDAAVGATIVTSTTRPTVPFAGQTIFETDTDSTLVWNGTAWKEVSSIADGSITAAKLATTAGAVMVFDDSAARGSAIPTPSEGMVTYLKDSDGVFSWSGSAWVPAANSASLGAGSILQVVSAAKTDTFTTSSATYTTVTGLSVSITPRATSSKILIIADIAYSLSSTDGYGHFKVTRGGTDIFIGDSAGSRVRNVFGGATGATMSGVLIASNVTFLDTPNTTSSTTYQVEVRQAAAGSVFVNRSGSDTDSAFIGRGASSITVLEVAG